MSQQITCPFCGFVNFAISTYCGRCERPLPQTDAQKAGDPANATIRSMPPRARGAPPPNAAAPERPSTPPIERIRAAQTPRSKPIISQEPTQALPRPTAPTARRPEPTPKQAQTRHEPTATHIQPWPQPTDSQATQLPEPTATHIQPWPQPTDSQAAQRPEPTATHIQPWPEPIPVPRPHDDATVVRAVAMPQEARAPDKFEAMYENAVASQPRRATALGEQPLRRRQLDDGPVEMGGMSAADEKPTRAPPAPVAMDTDPTLVPASQPAYWRLAGAFGIDAGLMLALGGAVVGSDMALFAGHWPGENGPLGALAEWLALYPNTALRAVGVMLGAGVLYSTWGARHGATLGRRGVGLMALHRSGRPLGWGRAVVRSLLGVLSLGAFGAGYFWALVDRRKRAWHDILVNSVVVHHRVR